jgi:Reverse transcriptase (RNA-dependent DNA polymerase)/Endonuclease-reverse transcriptase
MPGRYICKKKNDPGSVDAINAFGFFYCNVRSMMNKLSEVHDVLYNGNHDIVAITETWLSDKVCNGLIDPRGLYELYRCDRNSVHRGGGAIIAVKKYLHSSLTVSRSYTGIGGIELVGCNITLPSDRLVVICAYVAPNAVTDTLDTLILDLMRLCSPGVRCVLVGDFNMPEIDWINVIIPSSGRSRLLYDFSVDAGLTQLITESTRLGNILDLVFTNDPLIISQLRVAPPLGSSDHESLIFVIIDSGDSVNITPPSNRVLWKKADWNNLAQYFFSVNWIALFAPCADADQCWDAFTSALDNGISLYVPTQCSQHERRTHQPKVIRRLSRLKKQCWRSCRLNNNSVNIAAYKSASKKYKAALVAEDVKHEKLIITSGNLGSFYRHVNSHLTHRSGIAPLRDASGVIHANDATKANILNEAFVSVGTHDNGNLPSLVTKAKDFGLNTVYFDYELVHRSIMHLKANSSSGPDGYPPVLFKELIELLTEPLRMLFNLVMHFGSVPSSWKVAYVTPIFKKGSSVDPLNYRPISLTSVCSKLYEAGIKDHLLAYVNEHGFISDAQHGFLAKRSTCTNLLDALDDWTTNLDLKTDTLVAYIDFSKAFDSVSTVKLLYKLSSLGIAGNLWSCIESFLTLRTQRVRVGQELSSARTVISGVPQGSVLGPILFVLYVNDMVDVLPVGMKTKLFADDLKSYTGVASLEDVSVFNLALDRLTEWSLNWQLPISSAKSTWMRISNRASCDYGTNFTLSSIVILQSTEVKDLGILFEHNLSFGTYITSIIGKAKQRLFQLRKSFITKDATTLIMAFKSYVLPILDYCSPVWTPHHTEQIKRIESVQRTFTKHLRGYDYLSYTERLAKAGLCGLELRRLRTDLIYCYKILHGLVKIGLSLEIDTAAVTRGHIWRIKTPKPRLDTRLHFFVYRVARVWNKLKSETVCASSVNLFKDRLSSEDLSSYLTNPL